MLPPELSAAERQQAIEAFTNAQNTTTDPTIQQQAEQGLARVK